MSIQIKVMYFQPFSPVELEQFLAEWYADGWRLIAVDNGFYIFEKIT